MVQPRSARFRAALSFPKNSPKAGLGVVLLARAQARAKPNNHGGATLEPPRRGYSGEGTAGSFSPRIRRLRAVSRPPTALTCSVAFARPKTGMFPYTAS